MDIQRSLGTGPVAWRRGGCTQDPKCVRSLERSMPHGSGTHLACQWGVTVGFDGSTPPVTCRDAPVALPHWLTLLARVEEEQHREEDGTLGAEIEERPSEILHAGRSMAP